ncbi:MAG: methyltransferase domain-containing protein [Nitrospirae bacterium]|nr:methyltransferase domain-containing protein [Nitrospirota bacterium]
MDRAERSKDLLWLRQSSSFFASRIILTANRFRVFDHLAAPGKTAPQLSRTLRTDARATELLLNSLVAIGLLIKRKDVFRNTAVASRYLVSQKAAYQGDILRHYSTLWDNWSGLDTVVKTGKPYRKAHDHEAFILGMHNLALLRVKKVLAALDLRGVRRVLDLGGGPGTYAMAFAKKSKETVLMDFPETLKIAKRLIDTAGLGRKISLFPGDFTRDDIGSGYDLVLISQIIHAYDDTACISMLKKCYRALNPGGKVVVQEFLLSETHTAPPWGALFAINMLVNTPGGRTYTPKEMTSWIRKAGFREISSRILDETVLITATKKLD